jgi:hypothetical protein
MDLAVGIKLSSKLLNTLLLLICSRWEGKG